MPKLGFKLWVRKKRKQAYRITKLIGKNLNAVTVLILSALGLFLTLKGNNLAKASYELAKNDTTQQASINELKEISKSQKAQIDTLVAIIQELRKINNSSDVQTKLISSNAKPTFKIFEYSSNLNEKGNIEITLFVKNTGQRPAFDLSYSMLALTYENEKITSSEFLKNTISSSQTNLQPSGEINYSFISELKYNNLDKTITVCRFIYLDNALSKKDTSIILLKNIATPNNGQYYEDIGGPFKYTILKYLKQKGL